MKDSGILWSILVRMKMLEKVVTVKENQQEIKKEKKTKKTIKFINNVPCNYRDAKKLT